MCGNGVLRRTPGPVVRKRTGEWRKLFNDNLHNLHPSQNITAIKTREAMNV
jgi:hypothetical protein